MRRSFVAIVLCFVCFAAPRVCRGADDAPAFAGARAKIAAGDSAGALRDLSAYVPGHPDDVNAARLLGDLYFRVPDYRDAEIVWKRLVARQPGDRETHNRLGSLYAAQDRISDAIAEYEKSLPSRGGFSGLVQEHRQRGDLGPFEAQLARNAADNLFDVPAQSFYASILRAEHRFGEAQPLYDRAVGLAPKSCSTLVDAGNNLIDLSRLKEALDLLNRCLAVDPRDYAANVDTGEAFIELNDDAKARTYFDRALVTRPEGSEAFVDLGYLDDDRGQWKSAVVEYLQAIDSDPLESAAYIDLGYDYNEHQLYGLAEAAFIKGLSVAPEDGRIHYMLAVTYNVQGKVDLAREQYHLAIASQEAIVVHAAQAELALLPPAR